MTKKSAMHETVGQDASPRSRSVSRSKSKRFRVAAVAGMVGVAATLGVVAVAHAAQTPTIQLNTAPGSGNYPGPGCSFNYSNSTLANRAYTYNFAGCTEVSARHFWANSSTGMWTHWQSGPNSAMSSQQPTIQLSQHYGEW